MPPKKVAPKRLPNLPSSVEAGGGRVTVEQVQPPLKHEDGTLCNGLYDSERRHIQIDRTLPLRHRWRVLYHELVHVALLDSGLDNGISEALHEAIADAIATQRLRERFG